jgi:octaprenyl-diphosphate synthase
MAEGKLTLPVIYALTHEHDDAMNQLAKKVKQGTITSEEIAILVQFAKEKGGIAYAEQRMRDFHHDAQRFIDTRIQDATMRQSLQAYLDYVIQRSL